MKRLITSILIVCLTSLAWSKEYIVYGPQGGLDMTITLPKNFNTTTDSCPMVILMHGIHTIHLWWTLDQRRRNGKNDHSKRIGRCTSHVDIR